MNTKKLYVAGGCFWCTESDYRKINGVSQVISGFSGGHVEHPTYTQVCTTDTGHREAVEITYDADIVSYRTLLLHFFDHIDPTDAGGQFHDRGFAYTTAIFFQTDEEKEIAEKLIFELQESGLYDAPIATVVEKYRNFYPAEEYHQDYSEKNPMRYGMYRMGSGRDATYKNICAIKEEKGLVNLFAHGAEKE